MKKFLSLVLAAVMCLSLVACGGAGNSGDKGHCLLLGTSEFQL